MWIGTVFDTIMSSFNDRIDVLLKLNKKTKVELSQYAGISKQSFHDWKKRGTIPAADIALKIAEFLNTTVEYLVIDWIFFWPSGPDLESFSKAGIATVKSWIIIDEVI